MSDEPAHDEEPQAPAAGAEAAVEEISDEELDDVAAGGPTIQYFGPGS